MIFLGVTVENLGDVVPVLDALPRQSTTTPFPVDRVELKLISPIALPLPSVGAIFKLLRLRTTASTGLRELAFKQDSRLATPSYGINLGGTWLIQQPPRCRPLEDDLPGATWREPETFRDAMKYCISV